ncbi:MAG: response regulator PleD [Euryarchaeota archaeon ADurb.Bin294]|jgi:DNA-binding response OmpR family regulator|nr:MAG: response regulator PleD [Euryarchaeota archaeon ADurb.Bin294]
MTPGIDIKPGPVLIVDDDVHNLQVTAQTIHQAGYDVLLAQDGLNALEICNSITPGAILLDIMMPHMNGIMVCTRLKQDERFSSVPIIFLSALGEEDMIQTGLSCGGADYVCKPFQSRVLLARLRLHMEQSVLRTLLHEKNKQLEEHNRMLQKSEQSLKHALNKLHLLSGITRHDILNKITALNGYMCLIREEVTSEEGIAFVRRAHESIDVIRKQITFTRDYQEMGIHSPGWFDIRNVLEEAFSLLDTGLVVLDIHLDPVECYADPLLPRVFYNLLENSIHHGKHVTRIRVSNEIRDDRYVIIIEDDGCGIPTGEKENIFTRKYFHNSGYGLFLSRNILQITGYTIIENGEPGRSARFEISVPPEYYRPVIIT